MANQSETTNISLSAYGKNDTHITSFTTNAQSDKKEKENDLEHLERIDSIKLDSSTTNLQKHAAIAAIQQQHTIPTTGKQISTSKWEYIFFCVFNFSNAGAPINANGGALRQALLNQQFPDGKVPWSGRTLPMNSMLLDVTGILFGAQLAVLLTIGPYADYGNWRPWIMIISEVILYGTQFGMCGTTKPYQWQIAQGLFVAGSLVTNVTTAFYAATFPGLAYNLRKLTESEKMVQAGTKSPEEHAKLDSYERSKFYNTANITASALVVAFYGIAMGISARVGYNTQSQLIHSYQVLMAYFGAITVLCTVPFFIAQKHRPGQQLPEGTKWWNVGFLQVWSALKSIRQLKQCLIYLFAYFMIQESYGTFYNLIAILQNETVKYDPLLLNAMALCADLGGGLGTAFMLLLQKKFRISVKAGVFYGACMTLLPNLWGGIGYFTETIGFHHVWEFWFVQLWNFQLAAWGTYQVVMITEVVPAPKAYMFFALFNTVGKTSGFIGPFISSAIVNRANGATNAAYWFLFAMGSTGVIALWFVDTDKAKNDIAKYLGREASEYYSEKQREDARRRNIKSIIYDY
ncbi:putative autophagy protein [Xylogone sp. PMI_703]|nr:putative autophagy protein [Xylogone sp. PMI_703]